VCLCVWERAGETAVVTRRSGTPPLDPPLFINTHTHTHTSVSIHPHASGTLNKETHTHAHTGIFEIGESQPATQETFTKQ